VVGDDDDLLSLGIYDGQCHSGQPESLTQGPQHMAEDIVELEAVG
jgi:hypothetical protein